MKRAKSNIKVREARRIQKLFSAIEKLGVSAMDVGKAIKFSNEVDDFKWAFSKKERRGFFLANPKAVDKYHIDDIALLLQRETLHYAVFSGYRDVFTDLKKHVGEEIFRTVTEGVVWNTLGSLGSTYRGNRVSRILKSLKIDFPKDPMLAPISPFLRADRWYPGQSHYWQELKNNHPDLFDKIRQASDDIHKDNNISSAAYALKSLQPDDNNNNDSDKGSSSVGDSGGSGSGGGNPGGGSPTPQVPKKSPPQPKTIKVDGEDITPRELPDKAGDFEAEVQEAEAEAEEEEGNFGGLDSTAGKFVDKEAEHFNDYSGKRFSTAFSKAFQRLKLKKRRIDARQFKKRLARLNTKRILDEASKVIKDSTLPRSVMTQPYIYNLTRMGLTYVAIGLSGEVIPLFWNKYPESAKPKFAVYVDTSPSMDRFKQEEVYLIGELINDLPTQLYQFAGTISEISVKEFASGEYQQGCSTSFESVLNHFIELRGYDDCLIITDGGSSAHKDTMQAVVDAGKTVYVVYFSDYEHNVTSCLDEISRGSSVVFKPDYD